MDTGPQLSKRASNRRATSQRTSPLATIAPGRGRAPGAHSTGAHDIQGRAGRNRRFTLWTAVVGALAVAAAGIGFAVMPRDHDGPTVIEASTFDGGLGQAFARDVPSATASAAASAGPSASASPSALGSASPTGQASATGSPAPGGTGAPSTTGSRPAVPAIRGGGRVPGGMSGVVVGGRDKMTAWEQFRGSKVTVVNGYTDRSSWSTIIDPWIGGEYAGWDGQLVISQPFFPDGGGDFGSCANGAYSSQWAQFGSYLNNIGRPKTIVRLAWEFNGDWFPWSVGKTDVDTWKRCFQQVVGAIRSTDPQVRIDWNLNAHSGRYDAYPGDSYVDIIGIDNYDMWPASVNESSWNSSCNASSGLCDVIRFARQHGKQFSVSEWGLVSGSDTEAGAAGQAGGDNPFFIKKMYDTFKANADVLAYETYFNNSDAGNVHSSLLNPNENPNASAAYASLW